MTSLKSLPDELIVKIYEFTDKEHFIGGLSETCSRFHEISTFDPLWIRICRPIFISMGYNKREIAGIKNYREFYFKEKRIKHRIIDLLVSFESSYKFNSVSNDGDIDFPYQKIKEICSYQEFALPTLEMIIMNSHSLLIPSLAMICSKIIFRRKGANQLIDIVEYLEARDASGGTPYQTIDLITALLWLHNGSLPKNLKELIYDMDSNFKLVGSIIIKNKQTRFAAEALIQLRERLHEATLSTSALRGYFIDTQYGLFPCFQGICDGFPYHLYLVLESRTEKSSQYILPCSPYSDAMRNQPDSDIFARLKYITKAQPDSDFSNNLLVIDMDNGVKIRNVKEILYTCQIKIDNEYKPVMRKQIKHFFNTFLSVGLGKGDNLLRIRIQKEFLSTVFNNYFKLENSAYFEEILNMLTKERYYNQISWHRQIRRNSRIPPLESNSRLDYYDFVKVFVDKTQTYIPYKPMDYQDYKFKVGDFVKAQPDGYYLVVGLANRTQSMEPCYNTLSKDNSTRIVNETALKRANDHSFVVSNYIVSSWNFTQGYLLVKDIIYKW